MWDVGTEPTMVDREVSKSEGLRWGVHTRDAGQLPRVCQWLRDQPWAQARESGPRLSTGAMGRRRSEVRRCRWLAAEAGDSPAA
jgi:hypothetical protein